MAEIIGVVSGILTITNAIKNALELAKTLYKAPEDILALQVYLPLLSYDESHVIHSLKLQVRT
jgi:hypothetical protein